MSLQPDIETFDTDILILDSCAAVTNNVVLIRSSSNENENRFPQKAVFNGRSGASGALFPVEKDDGLDAARREHG